MALAVQNLEELVSYKYFVIILYCRTQVTAWLVNMWEGWL